MKKFAVIVAAALFASPALADAPVQKPAAPPAKQMTVAEALTLLTALDNLDGHVVVVKQDGKETSVMQPWDFGSGLLRLHIASDIRILQKVQAEADAARVGIVKELIKQLPLNKDGTQATAIPQGSALYPDFQKQYQDVLEAPATEIAGLIKIRASELKLDKNEIPVSALAALGPILIDDVSK